MRYIVSGATGFIGRALCRELLASGNDVAAVVRPRSERLDNLRAEEERLQKGSGRLRIIELPLEEIGKLREIDGVRADVFFHLAWNGAAGGEREDFDAQYVNIAYTAEAIRAAKACGCRRFIGAGSQAEYGVIRKKAHEDRTLPHPFMMYGAAKLAAYEMGRTLAAQLGMTFIWPRIYSVYGAGENAGTLVSYVVDSLLRSETPQLSSCENMWNFLYIDDCAKMLHELGESERAQSGIYHVASEDTRVLAEFVKEIRDIVAPEEQLAFGAKESDPARTFWLDPDTEKIRGVAGECKWTFRRGIQEKLNDYSMYHNKRPEG